MTKRRGQGEGSIYQRERDGKWVAVLDFGWRDGKRVRKTATAKTRREAADKLKELQRDLHNRLPVLNARRTLEDFLNQWIEEVVIPTTRPRTVETYRGVVNTHLIPALGKRTLAQLRPQHVQRMVADKAASGLSARTVEIIWSVLYRALKVAVRWELVATNAAETVTPPRPQKKDVEVFAVDETRKVLDASEDVRNGVAFVLALTTGMRRGEVLGLRWSDIDTAAGTLRVSRSLQRIGKVLVVGEPKSDRSRRTVRLSKLAIKALERHRASQAVERLAAGPNWRDEGYVIATATGGPVEPRNLLRGWANLLVACELAPRALHVARHSAASLMLSEGVPLKTVQDTLGHSTMQLTADLYGHLMPGDDQRVADAMDRALGG